MALLEPTQREQIFHTQSTIGGNVCELLTNEASCTNVASMTLINKLQLPSRMHLALYTLQWLKKQSKVTISKPALLSFLDGPYFIEVLRDILPMYACRLLLGRPWLFENHVIRDGMEIHMHSSIRGIVSL